VNNAVKMVLMTGSKDGKMLIWDMATRLKHPIRGYLLSLEKTKENSINILISCKLFNILTIFLISKFNLNLLMNILANFIRQHPKIKNEFLVCTTTGNILRLMCERSIVDSTYSKILGGGGMGLRWSAECVAVMSNIQQNEKSNFSGLKLEMERIAKSEGLKEITLDDLIRFKIDIDKLYTNSIKDQFNPHFKNAHKLRFNPGNSNYFLTLGEDNFLKIYDYDHNMPLQVL
jgi:WD40 repeat protein